MFLLKTPFEIHLTTDHLSSNRQKAFVDFCRTREAKPLLIELSKGDFIHQPMFSKVVYAASVSDVLSIATELSTAMGNENFSVKRLKIEVPAHHAEVLNGYASNFAPYFEWHCKTRYTQPSELLALCEKHKVHLSLNALKNEAPTRFVTLREFGTKLIFEQRIAEISKDLKEGNWTILKQESEYCIYDNNCFLDNGWLPQ